MKKILFVIPAYNEEENIEKVLNEIKKDVHGADILVINDCSKDNTRNIVLKNDDHRELRFYLSADVLDSLDTDTSGLSVYNITITNEGEEFYNGTLDDLAALSSGRMSEDTLLASLQKGETTTVTMTLEVNGDSMDNTYQNREGLIKFNFSVEELDDQSTIVEVVRNVYESIKTGDATVIAPLLGLVAVSGFAVIFLLKKKKHKEDCSHEEN